jgi:putative SOS response-associated peptidase YedK
MCERFSLTTDISELTDYFQIDKVLFHHKTRYSLNPTELIPVVIFEGEVRILDQYTWGIFPHWAKDAVNAASETIHDKPAYRKSFIRNRCIIPCDGFYGWNIKGKIKQPMRFVTRNRGTMGLAGFYDIWTNPRGSQYRSCTILTTTSNQLISKYQSRMPAILEHDALDDWLNPRITDKDTLTALLRPYPTEQMHVYPVAVGGDRSSKESPNCIREVSLDYALTRD